MAKVLCFLAPGFEEIEAITPIDVLRRAGIEVSAVAVDETLYVEAAHGVIFKADIMLEDADFDSTDMLLLPGGMPGTLNLDASEKLKQELLKAAEKGQKLAAICAAPIVLGGLGLLEGKEATCYPGNEAKLAGATHVDKSVVRSSDIITGNGPGAAMEFAFALVEMLKSKELADEIAAKMMAAN